MSFGTIPAKLDMSQPKTPHQANHFLLSARSAYYDFAPWKYTAYSKLHEFETSPSAMQINENLLVAQSTAMFARSVLDRVHEPELPSPSVCPVSGESLGIVWTVGHKQLEAIFAPDASGSYILSVGDEIVEDGEISRANIDSLERALRSILIA
jgi:hypothetical protein